MYVKNTEWPVWTVIYYCYFRLTAFTVIFYDIFS